MNILFVDDDVSRFNLFKDGFDHHNIVWAKTSVDAILAMQKNSFDFICLDHDLSDCHTLATGDGVDIALWIRDQVDNGNSMLLDAQIIIHSLNTRQALRMADILNLPDLKQIIVFPNLWHGNNKKFIGD